jgi:hypothetical protein
MLSLPGGAAELRLWSAERPHLYLLLLSLVTASVDGGAGEEGRVLEWEACQVCGSGQFWRCLTACGLVLSSAQVYLVPWVSCRTCAGSVAATRPAAIDPAAADPAVAAAMSPCQVGFRHAEISGRQLLHNGQPVMMKGRLGGESAFGFLSGCSCWGVTFGFLSGCCCWAALAARMHVSGVHGPNITKFLHSTLHPLLAVALVCHSVPFATNTLPAC